MIFFDTETCGLHGMPVLIQYARGQGPVVLHNIWTTPVFETLKLIEDFCNEDVIVGFNLAFDWFHLCKVYTIFSLLPDPSVYPEDVIEEIALLEPKGRDGVCLKPKSAIDLMLHARKGPYQSTMDRSDVRVKRIPTALAWLLAEELETRIPMKDIYFARRKDKSAKKWQVDDITDADGNIDTSFKDIVLRFAPSSALKTLAVDALGVADDVLLKFIDVDCNMPPEELGYAPYALAIGEPGYWRNTWPDVIKFHITHWAYNELARKYAANDVVYTRGLYRFFAYLNSGTSVEDARAFSLTDTDCPNLPDGDDDSILACMVAAVRWHGFSIDTDKLEALKSKNYATIKELPASLATAPAVAKRYIEDVLDPAEKLVMQGSTKKIILEEVASWDGHPAAERAKTVLNARKALKEIEVIDKLRAAGRFHASFKVIGTLSSRMSGADGLNPQGINHSIEFREAFPLTFDGYTLCGGDFDSFEVSLAEAEYNDPQLRADLMAGKKIHGLLGEQLFPDMSYEQIMASKGTDDDHYIKGKQGVFALIYGGETHTLHTKLGIDTETAEKAYQGFLRRYPKIGEARKRIFDMFCSMRQPGGIGSKVEWNEPSDYVESILGFKRFFTLENRICKTLFELAESPPPSWNKLPIKVMRRDRLQTASGAVRSALFAASFAIQSSNMRAACNHRIQSTGAQITKRLQRKIWDHQPCGIGEWIVLPINIHDEVLTLVKKGYEQPIADTVKEVVESYRSTVPLIGMKWKVGLKTWADK